MQRNYVHYFSTRKNPHHGEALIKGFNAKAVPVELERLEKDAVHIVGGLQFGALTLMKQLIASDMPYLFVDRAYFGGGPGTNKLRIVPNGYQHHWTEGGWDVIDKSIKIQPWKTHVAAIMVVPPSQAIASLFGLENWTDKILTRLYQITDRPIFVSLKNDRTPLQERLAKCYAVVTFSSNVAVEAIVNGVPAYVSKHSAARPVAGALETLNEFNIDNPVKYDAGQRLRWATFLTHGQFSIDKIESGYAKKIIERQSWDLATT